MNKIILIGTYHKYQKGLESDYAIERFRSLLISIIHKYNITVIAEEMRLSDIAWEGKCNSIPCIVSTELGIMHQYSDPEPDVRCKLGICIHPKDIELKKQTDNWTDEQITKALNESDEKREKYWLEKLKELNSWPLLFICGSEHIDNFMKLLKNNGFEVILENQNWIHNEAR